MGDVVDMDSYRGGQWLAAEVCCMNCGYRWGAAAPIGTVVFECPNCECEKGLTDSLVVRNGDHMVCRCGNDLFRVTRQEVYCVVCGTGMAGVFHDDD
jgi:hypothetical protein